MKLRYLHRIVIFSHSVHLIFGEEEKKCRDGETVRNVKKKKKKKVIKPPKI